MNINPTLLCSDRDLIDSNCRYSYCAQIFGDCPPLLSWFCAHSNFREVLSSMKIDVHALLTTPTAAIFQQTKNFSVVDRTFPLNTKRAKEASQIISQQINPYVWQAFEDFFDPNYIVNRIKQELADNICACITAARNNQATFDWLACNPIMVNISDTASLFDNDVQNHRIILFTITFDGTLFKEQNWLYNDNARVSLNVKASVVCINTDLLSQETEKNALEMHRMFQFVNVGTL